MEAGLSTGRHMDADAGVLLCCTPVGLYCILPKGIIPLFFGACLAGFFSVVPVRVLFRRGAPMSAEGVG